MGKPTACNGSVSADPSSPLGCLPRLSGALLLFGGLTTVLAAAVFGMSLFPRPALQTMKQEPLEPPRSMAQRVAPQPASATAKRRTTRPASAGAKKKTTKKTTAEPLEHQMRLVINSQVNYKRPIAQLLTSMVEHKFNRWDDVIIIFGGSAEKVKPRKMYIPMLGHAVTVVNTTIDAYDYTTHAVLYQLRKHPLIKADSYFLLLDTMRVGKKFEKRYVMHSNMTRRYDLRIPWGAASNICCFGSGLVNRWKGTYNRKWTKQDAIQLEIGGESTKVRGARPIIFWARGNVTWLRPRDTLSGDADPYRTNKPRFLLWYPDFDLYKYNSKDHSHEDVVVRNSPR